MYSIGGLSRETGVKVPTIRYYEQIGLMPSAGRTAGNQRRYDDQGLARLHFIRHGRDLGLSLEAISALFDLGADPAQPCEEVDRIASDHLADIRSRIRRLQALERELERITRSCKHGLVGDCQVIAALADHGLCDTDHHIGQAMTG